MFYLNYHFGGKSLFVPPELIKGVGSSIHYLIAKFLKFAKQDSSLHQVFLPEVLDAEAIAFQLQDLFYHRIFYPFLQEAIASQSPDVLQLNHIWQGITQLIPVWTQLLIKNRPYCSHTDLLKKTFVEEELSLEKEFILPDQSRAKITGKFDSLIFDCETQRFCVVEYKTYAPSDPSAQLAQVALYSDMLSSREALPIDSAVYSLLPEFKAYHYSWEELQNSVYQVIPYKLQLMQQWLAWQPENPNPPPATVHDYLCNICPQQKKCQSYFLATVEESSGHRPEVIEFTPEILNPPTQETIEVIEFTPEILNPPHKKG